MFEECEIIETVRRRSTPDQTETLDDFIARYQPENGIDCDGEPTYPRPPDAPIEVEQTLTEILLPSLGRTQSPKVILTLLTISQSKNILSLLIQVRKPV